SRISSFPLKEMTKPWRNITTIWSDKKNCVFVFISVNLTGDSTPIPGFQEDLVLSGILAAVIYIIVLIVTLLALEKDEMKRFISFFKRQKSDM
ncbi:hypothetical protein KQ232_09990, partial [Lacticaseibacillus paracasei]|nr:hypothetical protein [Lacticaseibacillus paracasei]MCL4972718.1 hypothetical protein [Lacticaseibacillus paracasei]